MVLKIFMQRFPLLKLDEFSGLNLLLSSKYETILNHFNAIYND